MSREREQAFTRVWRDNATRVLAYALRHVDRDVAQDIVADTFLVAWRRFADLPAEPLPWLLVVARKTIANHRRSDDRRARLRAEVERLRHLAEPAPAADLAAVERAEVLAALARLTPREREALLLVAWDGLEPADAARVAGCGRAAFHVRLFRARRKLADRHVPEGRPITEIVEGTS
ncbi:RNA polymerase sigma-70 factor (ECF subfamily) [Actinoplanes octamycinicus]|uniref:RNA polymerase sigma-70 factor (ECF subfamily) n=1 Tax=Actinoplanes octamycinicus TaxID=135948 RepID=A0A7W7H747_9ACTN|nr:RNA polymerase sigma factor [Actinoplanes octamycinicus]MBB4745088.1 RNA polymerase sigma-70 factor (ECF subfamily) [Actinoplanes octamycinicus]GIE55674.1 DNA-directed RNA polymerase sigma-70 factor [Actinoplanes octamycinicus]